MSATPDDSGVVPIGALLDGRYRVDGVLGKGGMGRVYRGEHTGIGRAVAIKILHAGLGTNKEATTRFQREALAYGRLDHVNIVSVSDFGVLDDGAPYLVMEALEGEELGTRLTREQRIPWRESLEIMRGVLAGLRHAHERGVIHRDIKPDNVFLAQKDGEVVIKILDFGIAKLYSGTGDDPATTRAGLTVGTPAYLSPEQAVGGEITPASDLYSTSVVLYEMLTGRPPFDDKDPLAIMTAHVSRDVPTFAEVAPDLDVPAGIEDVIRRGLAKVLAERIQSASDYMLQLDDALVAAHLPAMMNLRATGPVALVTPPPGTLSAAHAVPAAVTAPEQSVGTLGVAETQAHLHVTPQPMRARSIADTGAPIPRRWIGVAGGVLAVVVLIGLALTASHHDKVTMPPVVVPIPTAVGEDRELRLKAALHDLEDGKTCAERRTAIPVLIELGDARAIPALKTARFRMRGGIAGIGDSNTNECLKSDAEVAIKALTR